MGLVQGLKERSSQAKGKGRSCHVRDRAVLTCHEGRGDARREEAAIAMKVCIRKGKGRESELVAKRL